MAYQLLSIKKTQHFSFWRAIHVLFFITLWGPGRSGWRVGTTIWVCVSLFRISKSIIACIQEKTMSQLVCCYLACEQGGTVGGKSSSHSLLFSPTPPGELARVLFTTVLSLVFITVIVSTHLCVICNYFSCLIISRSCCLSEFYPNSTSSTV